MSIVKCPSSASADIFSRRFRDSASHFRRIPSSLRTDTFCVLTSELREDCLLFDTHDLFLRDGEDNGIQ